MPVVRSGSFRLYGYTLIDHGGLTDGINGGPPNPGWWVCTNTGFFPTTPGIVQFSGPTLLDTTTEGTGFEAGAPPVGFRLHTQPLTSGPMLRPIYTMGSHGANNDANWDMGGKFALDSHAFPGPTEQDDPLLLYIELLDAFALHITQVNGFPFQDDVVPQSGYSSPATIGAPGGIEGGYDIIWWWWIIPDVDRCGNVNTVTPEDSESHLVLAAESPGSEYELLDPNDPDNAAPTPRIRNIVPNHGRGGTRVQIIGEGFGDGANVQFDGVDALDIDVVSQYQVLATAPSHANGFANVAVINPDGVST